MRNLLITTLFALSFLAAPIKVFTDGFVGKTGELQANPDQTIEDLMNEINHMNPQPEGLRIAGICNSPDGPQHTDRIADKRINEVIPEGSEHMRINLIKTPIQTVSISLFSDFSAHPHFADSFECHMQCRTLKWSLVQVTLSNSLFYQDHNGIEIAQNKTGKRLPEEGLLSDFMQECGLTTEDVLELRSIKLQRLNIPLGDLHFLF